MKYTLYLDYDGITYGYCDDEHLRRYREGKGVERPTAFGDVHVYCVGCGKLLARRVE